MPAAAPKKKKPIINQGLVSNQLSKINPIIVPTDTAATNSVPNLKALPINEPFFSVSFSTLLSGGEQALTALSLVFAVFLVNPSPICVLDEVDAPLDDANVTRFCGLLDDLTKITNTKFIIITHHALTMSRMDRLYGVTMAEQGVSQLVSVDLQRAEELVA